MTDYYKAANGILQQALNQIDNSFYETASKVFNNEFFNISFACIVLWFGAQIVLKGFKNEENAYQVIWTIFIFALVKSLLIDEDLFYTLIEFIDLPRNALLDIASTQVKYEGSFRGVGEIIRVLVASNDLLISTLLSKTKMFNLLPLFLGIILWLSSAFLLITLYLSTIFSMFMAKIIISLLPFVLISLLIKSTQRIFFSYVKMYIAISLYTPFALIFAVVSIEVTKLMAHVTYSLNQDLNSNYEYIIALVLSQVLLAVAILKIPNILNQIIGSDNEKNTFLSSSMAFASGSAVVGQLSKIFGFRFTGGIK